MMREKGSYIKALTVKSRAIAFCLLASLHKSPCPW